MPLAPKASQSCNPFTLQNNQVRLLGLHTQMDRMCLIKLNSQIVEWEEEEILPLCQPKSIHALRTKLVTPTFSL